MNGSDPPEFGRLDSSSFGSDAGPSALWAEGAYVWCGEYEGPALVPWTDGGSAVAARARRCEVRRAFAYAFRGILQVPRTVSHGVCDAGPRAPIRMWRSRGDEETWDGAFREYRVCDFHRAQLLADDARLRVGGWPSQVAPEVGTPPAGIRCPDFARAPLVPPREPGRVQR